MQDMSNNMEQQKVASQKELRELEERLNKLDVLRANSESRVCEMELNAAKIVAEKTSVG